MNLLIVIIIFQRILIAINIKVILTILTGNIK
jgi:hypothetical protein